MSFYAVPVQATITVSSEGKVTIPKPIRDSMDIAQGDTITIDVTEVHG